MSKNKKVIIGVLIVLLIIICVAVAYKVIEKSVTDREDFKFKVENIDSNPVHTVSNDNNEELDFYIDKEESHNDIKFNDYITYDDKNYYLADNIKEFYVIDGKTMILKAYITNFDHSLNDHSIKRITDELTEKENLNDGETVIHKSKDKDITIIEYKNKIYIGDYSMNLDKELMGK